VTRPGSLRWSPASVPRTPPPPMSRRSRRPGPAQAKRDVERSSWSSLPSSRWRRSGLRRPGPRNGCRWPRSSESRSCRRRERRHGQRRLARRRKSAHPDHHRDPAAALTNIARNTETGLRPGSSSPLQCLCTKLAIEVERASRFNVNATRRILSPGRLACRPHHDVGPIRRVPVVHDREQRVGVRNSDQVLDLRLRNATPQTCQHLLGATDAGIRASVPLPWADCP
jgi:hypothetical protein